MVERADLQAARINYLKKINEIRQKKTVPIIYLDETAINENHSHAKEWQSGDGRVGRNIPTGKGKRLVLLHAIQDGGFVPNCMLLFKATSTDGRDFHTEMNATVFENWVKTQLLPNVQEGSCIVMDNASYHSRVDPETKPPTSKSKKSEMIEWLKQNDIDFPQKILKPDVYKLVKANKPPKDYIVDKEIESKGHTVLRLPPYHCDLNPIENVWGIAKGQVADNNTTFNIDDVRNLMVDALEDISESVFNKTFRHTIDVEADYRKADGIDVMPDQGTFVINTQSDHDGSSSSDDESSHSCTYSSDESHETDSD